MSGRRVASLTSSLLARKGAGRPAAADDRAAERSPAPASAPVPSADPPTVSGAQTEDSPLDLRPYAWPTQGPPSDDGLAMPAPPESPPGEAPAAETRSRRGLVRGVSIVAVAAIVVAAALVLILDRPSGDAPRRAIADAAPGGAVTAISPMPSEPDAVAAGDVVAAGTVRDIAPAAGAPAKDPLPPLPSPATAIPSAAPARVAALPPPEPAPPPPISATTLAPPPIERPEPVSVPSMKAPPPAPAARPAARASSAETARPVAAGRYAVQIASVGSKPRAEAERARLARTLGAILDGRKPVIEDAAVAGRAVYRIRVGGYASKDAADRACAAIKGKGLGCLVVRR